MTDEIATTGSRSRPPITDRFFLGQVARELSTLYEARRPVEEWKALAEKYPEFKDNILELVAVLDFAEKVKRSTNKVSQSLLKVAFTVFFEDAAADFLTSVCLARADGLTSRESVTESQIIMGKFGAQESDSEKIGLKAIMEKLLCNELEITTPRIKRKYLGNGDERITSLSQKIGKLYEQGNIEPSAWAGLKKEYPEFSDRIFELQILFATAREARKRVTGSLKGKLGEVFMKLGTATFAEPATQNLFVDILMMCKPLLGEKGTKDELTSIEDILGYGNRLNLFRSKVKVSVDEVITAMLSGELQFEWFKKMVAEELKAHLAQNPS